MPSVCVPSAGHRPGPALDEQPNAGPYLVSMLPQYPQIGGWGVLRLQRELCYPQPDRKERSEVVTLSRGVIPMPFSEGEVLTLGTRAKKPERKYTCHPGLSLSPNRAILSGEVIQVAG